MCAVKLFSGAHMNALSGLKLVASKKNRTLSPVAHRRNKLVNKLHEQIELAFKLM